METPQEKLLYQTELDTDIKNMSDIQDRPADFERAIEMILNGEYDEI